MRDAPAGTLAQLREIDPSVDLIYIGGGKWVLGARLETMTMEQRRRAGGQLLRALSAEDPQRVRLAREQRDGFAKIGIYSEQEVNNGLLVQDFRVRDYLYRKDRDGEFLSRVEAHLPTTRARESFHDDWMRHARDVWTYAFRHKQHFLT